MHRIKNLERLLAKIRPIPPDWQKSKSGSATGNNTTLECVPCDSYRQLIHSWKAAMKWTDGLDCALSVMLASITSTMSVGDQLWFKIVAPPSTGKSTLCEAISIATKYVLAKSTIRGFHSGFGMGNEDHSLISQVSGKTLVTKDGDTLLKSPNLGQILSEARDVYDTTSRASYRKKSASRDYSGIRMTWILAGTSSLKQLDHSELGARFLDCVIMHEIDPDMEDEILIRVANRAKRNAGLSVNGHASTQQDPDLTKAMQLTGGYVNYLRENAEELLSQVDMCDAATIRCGRLGLFTAFMRARPSKEQKEIAEREFASRLVSQITRTAMCIAAVLNKQEVDEEVMRRVTKVALDTSRGQTYDVCNRLFLAGHDGLELRALSLYTSISETEMRELLRFLVKIKCLEIFEGKTGAGTKLQRKWRLAARVGKLFKEVHHEWHNNQSAS